jgi:hypothetical protein
MSVSDVPGTKPPRPSLSQRRAMWHRRQRWHRLHVARLRHALESVGAVDAKRIIRDRAVVRNYLRGEGWWPRTNEYDD